MKFKYEGFMSGKPGQRGEIEASSKEAASALLRAQGIYLQQIVPVTEELKPVLTSAGTEPVETSSAFVPAEPGFVGVPRDGVLPTGVSNDAKTAVEPAPQVEELFPRGFPEEGQFKPGPELVKQTAAKEEWQIEFGKKILAFTHVMEELKLYIEDPELLREVTKVNLGYIVGGAHGDLYHSRRRAEYDKVLKQESVKGQEEKKSEPKATKRKKK